MTRAQAAEPAIAPGALDVHEAAAFLCMSVDLVYAACAGGKMRYYRVGRKILIPHAEAERYQRLLVEETMQKEHNVRELRR